MPKLSVIIINYNGHAFLPAALEALNKQTFTDFEVIVLDNNSPDKSGAGLDLSAFPQSKLILEAHNHGYAKGNNLAIEQASGEWIVLLNPDTVATPDFLEKLVTASDQYSSVNAFCACQYLMEPKGHLDGVGDAYLVFGFPWRGGFGHPENLRPDTGAVFSPCGAGAMIRRDTFLSHGGFDTRFFMYCEDVDLGFRMRLAGETCVYVSDAIIHHAGSGISGRYSDNTIYHGTRNRIWTYAKNMPTALFLLTLPGHLTLSAYLLIRAMMTGRGAPTWRGMRDGFRGAWRMRRSKEFRWTQPRIGIWKLARTMAWNPWKMSKRLPHVQPIE